MVAPLLLLHVMLCQTRFDIFIFFSEVAPQLHWILRYLTCNMFKVFFQTCWIGGTIYYICRIFRIAGFCKTGVSSYLSTRQILVINSVKLYMPTTTKTKLNIRHSIHVRIQHMTKNKLLIAF